MTISEAAVAARRYAPVVYEDPMEGPLLFARIAAVRKEFAPPEDAARGKAAEYYTVELWPASGGRSVTVADPGRVRLAEAGELRDPAQYPPDPWKPAVHPELLCEEVRTGRPW